LRDNLRLKTLFNNKFCIKSNATTKEKSDMNHNKNKYFILPYIHGVSEIVNSMANKSNFIFGYNCINKLNNIIKG